MKKKKPKVRVSAEESVKDFSKTLETAPHLLTNLIQADVLVAITTVVKGELVTKYKGLEKMTCFRCPGLKQGCPFSWDGYNTDGDCLATK